MPDTTTYTEAQAWCTEVRKFLGKSKDKGEKQTGKDLNKRAKEVAGSLKTAKKALDSTKKNKTTPIDQADFDHYQKQFADIATALVAAQKAGDIAEIERQSGLLEGLKLELTSQLKSGKKAESAKDALGDQQKANLDAALQLRKALKDEVAGEAAPIQAAMKPHLQPLKDQLKQAAASYNAKDYDGARDILTTVNNQCGAARDKLKEYQDQHGEYQTKLLAAQTAIGAIDDKGEGAVIKDLLDAINAKLATAKGHDDKGEFEEASRLLDEIPGDCTAAGTAATLADSQHKAYTTELTRVDERVKRREGHAQHAMVDDDLAAMRAKLQAAAPLAAAFKYVEAKAAVEEVDDLCNPLWAVLTAAETYAAAFPTNSSNVAFLNNPPFNAAIGPELVDINAKFAAAKAKAAIDKKKAAEHDFAAANALLLEVSGLSNAAHAKGTKFFDYQALLPIVRNAIAKQKKHPGRDGAKAELATMETKLAEAIALAAPDTRNYAGAHARLAEAQALIASAESNSKRTSEYLQHAPGWKRRVEALKIHPQKAAFQADLDNQILPKVVQMEAKETAGDYLAARALLGQIVGPVRAAEKSAANLQYPIAKPKAQAAITKVKALNCPGIAREIKALDIKFAEAERQFAAGGIHRATEILAEVELFCARAEAIAKKYNDYQAALKTATERVAALRGLGHEDIIAARLTLIDGKVTLATEKGKPKDKAKEPDFDWAMAILATIDSDCAAAQTIVEDHKEHLTALEKAKGLSNDIEKDPQKAVGATRALFNDLVKEIKALKDAAFGETIKVKLAAAKTLIDDAEKLTKSDQKLAAKPKLEEAAAECVALSLVADRHAQYKPALKAAEDLETELKGLPEAGDADKTAIEDQLKAARAHALKHEYGDAMPLLAKAAAECKKAITKAKIAAKLKADTPTAADLKDLVDQPGGTEILDEMVKGMDDATQRKVLKAAIEARFGLTLEMYKADWKPSDMEKGAPNLKRLYELMQMVPNSHTKDNPKLAKIERYGGKFDASDRGNFYRGSEGLVVISCGRVGVDAASKMSVTGKQASELEVTDDNCKPDDSVPDPPLFNWVTLHEVGHAVDDKQGFMASKDGNSTYGGWKDYGSDISEVAAAIHAKCGYDLDFIKGYLKKSPPAEPAVPGAPGVSDPLIWAAERDKAKEWCDAIRVDKSLWWKQTESKDRALGDPKRVYQEAYGGSWVSYELAKRGEGVSGYQFRAPGEWFAELYSAFHTKKMKSGHPAYGWLEKL